MAKTDIPKRAVGVLLPVSSLPSPYGIGAFGKQAYQWVDFLQAAGQSYWQVLPLGPTSYGDSPYQSFSAFAGNPYFIDLDTLCRQGLLQPEEFTHTPWGATPTQIDYAALYQYRGPLLHKAFARFAKQPQTGFEQFKKQNAHWLPEYALYMAIKQTQGQKAWPEWEDELKLRKPQALARCQKQLAQEIDYYCFVQYLFFEQWNALRQYAAEKKVQIIGDIPIYVAMDSADVWANKDLFILDKNGLPTAVAGCPPDSFSSDGQLWGNPLYNWQRMQQDGYAWWVQRMQASFTMYDVLRIDHFRGLESYYTIPYGNTTAKVGEWKPGPGMGFVNTMKKALPNARIIAEDLGFLTDDVRRLLKDSGYPGMKVLQFAFDSREESDYSPYKYIYNNVVYTGTHDNDTVAGWARNAPLEDVKFAMEYTATLKRHNLPMAFIRLALQTGAGLAIVPLQDWLGLGSFARINTPATLGGNNWRWRMAKNAVTPALAAQMKHMAKLYGRA